jgi:hypothetical protein
MKYKSMVQLKIGGAPQEVSGALGRGFDVLLSRAGLDGSETDAPAVEILQNGPMLYATVAVDTMIQARSEYAEKLSQLVKEENEARERASLLQTAYVEAVTRKQTEVSIAISASQPKDSKGKEQRSHIPKEWWVEMAKW